MCSINGCIDFADPHFPPKEEVIAAGHRLRHRGPDACGSFFAAHVAFYHNRLAVMDPANGAQPMQAEYQGVLYTIVYNGEIYNADELRRELAQKGAKFSCKRVSLLQVHKKTCAQLERY